MNEVAIGKKSPTLSNGLLTPIDDALRAMFSTPAQDTLPQKSRRICKRRRLSCSTRVCKLGLWYGLPKVRLQ